MRTAETHNIRPELSETAFRRFEPIINNAVVSYPNSIKIIWTDSGLRCVTFVSRLRDAIRSFRLYKWPTNWFNPNTMTGALNSIVTVLDPNDQRAILIGPKQVTVLPPVDARQERIDHYQNTVPLVGLLPLLNQPTETPSAVSAGLLVPMELLAQDLDALRTAVTAYCALVALGLSNLGKLRIAKPLNETTNNQFRELLNTLDESYDVAVIDETTHYVLF